MTLTVRENTRTDRLYISIQDDGKGMDAETVKKVIDPFVTSRTTRKVGLGLPLLKEAAEMCNGFLQINSTPGKGTQVEVEFQRSHIDRMPLGDMTSTILNLVIGYPHVHWVYTHQIDDRTFTLDDAPIKKELDGVPLSESFVISFLRELLEAGLENIQPETSRMS